MHLHGHQTSYLRKSSQTNVNIRSAVMGNLKKSNINKIQAFQNIALRLANVPPYVSNFSLHPDLKLKTISDEHKCYKIFHNHLSTHSNTLIKNLASPIPYLVIPKTLKAQLVSSLMNN